jgi:uncharacterized protein
MFCQERTQPQFQWTMLGDIDAGRPNLGQSTSVAVYRLMQFTLRDVMIQHFGVARTDAAFFEAGKRAGLEFHEHLLTKGRPFSEYVNELQEKLKELKVGLLRLEKSDPECNALTLTVAEDLDCSGLPVCDEQICTYDEGFLAGLLEGHSGKPFAVKEVDCWCSGDRVCRFEARAIKA